MINAFASWKLAGAATALTVFLACTDGEPALAPGRWRAALETPGGPIPVIVEIEEDGDGLRAALLNAGARSPASSVTLVGRSLTLEFAHYGARIEAIVTEAGKRLEGTWTRTLRGPEPARLVFHAVHGDAPRFEPAAAPPSEAAPVPPIGGRWDVDFADDDDPAIGVFEQHEDGAVTGTFLTPTGDKRHLEGRLDGRELRLSGFDGGQALLVRGRLLDDGSLAGELWSRDAYHDTFTAVRNDDARLPDGFALTEWIDGVPLDRVRLRDLDGRERTLADPAFAGAARIVEVMGTWCPNCGDSATLLAELHERYQARGLSVVGVAFEFSDDFARSAALVSAFRERYGVRFPVLIGGVAQGDRVREALPFLGGIRAYPTTIFLDAKGRITAVHTGFAGPATGEAHEELRAEFVERIEALLASSGK